MKPLIIGVCGGSCSGKSTFVSKLTELLSPKSCILAQDNYYKDFSNLSLEEKEKLNFDDPNFIDFDEMTDDLDRLIGSKSIDQPQYDFTFHQRKTETLPIHSSPLVLVEGLHILWHKPLRQRLDLSFYLFETEEKCLDRRLARDTKDRGRTTESIKKQWNEQVQPMFEKFILPQKQWAQFVLHQSDEKKTQNLNHALEKIRETYVDRNK